jgi:hypothetical protein
MMSPNTGKTVREILRGKRGYIRACPLEPGSLSWDDILDLTWEEVEENARNRVPGFHTFRKLLTDRRFNK